MANKWIVTAPDNAAAPHSPVLYCFHHAGGSAASYNGWCTTWPAGSRLRFVELPGRPGAPEPLPFTEVEALMPPLLRAFLDQHETDTPYAFYGHSLGALVAYRLTRALLAHGHAGPALLAVSGRRAPTAPLRGEALWNLPEAALIEALRALGGMAQPLLASAKWRDLFLPIMRADLRLSDEYQEAPDAPLPMPLLALHGHDDPIVPLHELNAWRALAGAGFEQAAMPGTHFFTAEGLLRVRQRLQDALAGIRAAHPHGAPQCVN
ncbi:thioesterase domain-containing protein [Burkholderia sp. FERM BP-3421]|jgi:surfactin synthase thioesterase subunit|uniref:thioesterase II family protein n=1 Tax=Burkholderia sp. FERM BP-3421 TaxID=1494466 RepID=UPI0023627B41|nr:thioesterase domain-containing protein [Burkholderia sp. FERM BP-3421]WDD92375.1 thioesterase domain-containing protein [Burkholderia sp. FERM BP-3421]